MQSKAKNVEAYIAQTPADRREALRKLRALCRKELKGFEESMVCGMPSYSRKGVVEVGFASQKNYISLFILRQDALETQRAFVTGANVGKGCIRYPRPSKIDYAMVRQMLAATRDSKGEIC